MLVERDAVFPRADLAQREYAANREYRDCCCEEGCAELRPQRDERRALPYYNREHAQDRHVHVAISHRLRADLHQPDDGHERAEKPQPAECEPRARSPKAPRERRSDNQHKHAENQHRRRPIAGMEIQRGQRFGPKRFAEVTGVGDERIADARAERKTFPEIRGAGSALNEEGENAMDRDEREERNFFQEESPPRAFWPAT